jgi:hypothetical protein
MRRQKLKKVFFVALIVVAMMFGVVAYASADPSPQTGSVAVSATVPPVFTLSVPQTAVSFTFADQAALESGVTGSTSTDIQVTSNKLYTLTAAVPDFAPASPTTLSASALGLTWDGGTTYTPGSASVQITANGTRGSLVHYLVGYKLTPGLNIEPGPYTSTVTYTATQK